MKKLEEFTTYLEPDYAPDLWSDHAVDVAGVLLDQLTPEEWERLAAGMTGYPIRWRVRLSEALLNSTSHSALELLLTLLHSDDLEVAVSAAESLEGFDDVWAADASLRSLLEDLHERVPDEDKYIFRILLDRIPG